MEIKNLAISLVLLLGISIAIAFILRRFDVFKETFSKRLKSSKNGIQTSEYVLELLKREINKAHRYNFPISILLLNIGTDELKQADFLERLQDTVERSIRETDVFGFWEAYSEDFELSNIDGESAEFESARLESAKFENSGFESSGFDNTDHFICILPHTKFQAAYDLAERLRQSISSRLFLEDDSQLIYLDNLDSPNQDNLDSKVEKSRVTVRCGISELKNLEDMNVFIRRTVYALEVAKASKENCTMPRPPVKNIVSTKPPRHLN